MAEPVDDVKSTATLAKKDFARHEAILRESTDSAIKSAIDRLMGADPAGRSADIQQLIRNLNGMHGNLALGMPPQDIAQQLTQILPAVDAEIKEEYAHEIHEMLEKIVMAAEQLQELESIQQKFDHLNAERRQRVVNAQAILDIPLMIELNHLQKTTLVKNMALPDDVVGTKMGDEIANVLVPEKGPAMEGVEEDIQTMRENKNGAKIAHIRDQDLRQRNQEAIAKLAHPSKAHAQTMAYICPAEKTNLATKTCKTPQDWAKAESDATSEFVARGSHTAEDALKHMSANEKQHLPKGGLRGAVDEVHKMYLSGKTQPATDTQHAAMVLVGTVAAKLELHDLAVQAKQLEHTKNPELTKLFDAHTTAKDQEQILTGMLQKQYMKGEALDTPAGKAKSARLAVMAHQTVEEMHKLPGGMKGIAQATPAKLDEMSESIATNSIAEIAHKAATVTDAATDVVTNIFTTDKHITDKISHRGGMIAKLAAEYVVDKKTAQEFGHTVTGKLKAGKEITNETISTVKGWLGMETFASNMDADLKKNLGAFKDTKLAGLVGKDGHKLFDLSGNAEHDVAAIKAALAKAHVNLADYNKGDQNHVELADLYSAVKAMAFKEHAIMAEDVKTGTHVAPDKTPQMTSNTQKQTKGPAHA